MKIDPRALKAAANALACIYQFNGIPEECYVTARRLIEAYEAARPEPNPWRPIEGAGVTVRKPIDPMRKRAEPVITDLVQGSESETTTIDEKAP